MTRLEIFVENGWHYRLPVQFYPMFGREDRVVRRNSLDPSTTR
jgi:hypothetical protein